MITKSLSLFFLATAFLISPLRVNAMMERGFEKKDAAHHAPTAAENTAQKRAQAAQEADTKWSSAASSLDTNFDDDSSSTVLQSAPSAEESSFRSGEDDRGSRNGSKGVELVKQLNEEIKAASESAQGSTFQLQALQQGPTPSQQEREEIQQRYQEICRYWNEECRTYQRAIEARFDQLEQAQRAEILEFVTASNKAARAAQGVLDFFAFNHISRASAQIALPVSRGRQRSSSEESEEKALVLGETHHSPLQESLHEHMRDAIAEGNITTEDWNRLSSHPTLLHQLTEKATAAATALSYLADFLNGREAKDITDPPDVLAKDQRTQAVMKKLTAYNEIQQWVSDAPQREFDDTPTIKEVVNRATKFITYKIVDPLDFKTEKSGAVFWTGYMIGNQDVAMTYAKAREKKTLEMTRDGSLLDGLGLFTPTSPIAIPFTEANGKITYKSQLGDTLFDAASEKFAKSATHDTTAVIIEHVSPYSAYARIERPILLSAPNVYLKEFVVMPDPLSQESLLSRIYTEEGGGHREVLLKEELGGLHFTSILSVLDALKKIDQRNAKGHWHFAYSQVKKNNAQAILNKAEEVDRRAREILSNSQEENVTKGGTYQAAEDAWNKAADALKKTLQNAPAVFLKNLQNSLHIAQANAAIWAALRPWIEAQETEARLGSSEKISQADAEEAESKWSNTIQAYNSLLETLHKTGLADTATALEGLIYKATERRAAWVDKISELKRLGERAPVNPADEEIRRRNKEERKRREREATRKALLQYQRSYDQWELLGELDHSKATAFDLFEDEETEAKEEKISEVIPPPKISDQELEKIGKTLLTQRRKQQIPTPHTSIRLPVQIGEATTITPFPPEPPILKKLLDPEQLQPAEFKETSQLELPEPLESLELIPPLTASEREEQVQSEIDTLLSHPTEADEARWAAREKADRLLKEVSKLIESQKDASREMKMAGRMDRMPGLAGMGGRVDEAEEEEEDEGGTIIGTQMGAFPNNLSVIGSTVLGAKTVLGKRGKKAEPNAGILTIDQAQAVATGAEKAWEELVHQADKKRVDQGGIPIDLSLAVTYWEEADKKAIRAQKEKAKRHEREKMEAAYRAGWAVNTARWKARMEAEQGYETAKEAEEKLTLLQEKRNQYDSETFTEKLLQEEIITTQEVSGDAKEKARAAEEKWLSLAENHHSVLTAQGRGEESAQKALERLKLADQAVINRWYSVEDRYKDDEFQENPEDPENPDYALTAEAKAAKEATAYKANLLAEGTAALADCFKAVNEELEKAKHAYENYTQNKTYQNKAIAKLLYEDVASLETAARNSYAKRAQEAARQAALENKPGAEAAWEARVAQSEKEAHEKALIAASYPPAEDDWADGDQHALRRAKALAEADHKASRVFEKEKKRLADIGMIWDEIMSTKKRVESSKREQAAQAYVQGDQTAWEKFTPEERRLHDQEVSEANEKAKEEATAAIEEAANAAKVARAQVRLTPSALFINAAQKAQVALSRLQAQEAKRENRIAAGVWYQYSPEERKALLEEHLEAARGHSEAASPHSEEQIRWQEALGYWKQALEADSREEMEFFLLWIKAAEQAEVSAHYLYQAALSETSETASSTETARLWHVAAEQTNDLAQRYGAIIPRLALSGEEAEATRNDLNHLEQLARQTTTYLEEGATYLNNARKVDTARDLKKADLWRKAAEHLQQIPKLTDHLVSSINNLTESKLSDEESGAVSYWKELYRTTDQMSRLESTACLNQAIDYLHNARETKETEATSPLSSLWMKAAEAATKTALKCAQIEQSLSTSQPQSASVIADYLIALCFLQQTDQESSIAESIEKKKKAEAANNESQASTREVIKQYQQSRELYARAANMMTHPTAENIMIAGEWYSAGTVFAQVANSLAKVIEAEAAGKIEEVTRWRKAAALQQQSAEHYYTQAARARAARKINVWVSWHMAGAGFAQAAEKLEKAIEAEQNESLGTPERRAEIAAQWREAAALQERSSEFCVKAAEAYAIGTPTKMSEGISWENVGEGFAQAAEKLGKVIETEQNESLGTRERRDAIAAQWREAAVLQERSNKFFVKAAEAYAIGTPEKKSEGASWNDAGLRFYNAAKNLGKAIEAEQNESLGSPERRASIAAQWREAAALQERSNEFYVKAAEAKAIATPESQKAAERLSKAAAFAEGDEDNSGIAYCLEQASELLGKASDAETSGKPDGAALAASYRDSATQYQRLAGFYVQAAEACLQHTPESDQTAERLSKAADFAGGDRYRELSSASCLDQASELLEKASAVETSGKPDAAALAASYRDSVTQYQRLAGFYVQAAEAVLQGTPESEQAAKRLSKATAFAGSNWNNPGSAYCLAEASKLLEKVSDAETSGKPDAAALAASYRDTATQYQSAAGFYVQAAEACLQHTPESDQTAERLSKAAAFAGNDWEKAGSVYCLAEASKLLEEASAAETSGKPDGAALAASCREAVTQWQHAAGFYAQAAQSLLQDTPESEQAAERLSKAAAFAGGNASYLYLASWAMEKASDAETSGKPNEAALAASYREAVTQWQHAAGFYAQAAQSVLQDTPESEQAAERLSKAAAFAGGHWENRGRAYCLSLASELLEKASDVETSGKPDAAALAASCRDFVTQYQRLAGFYTQAAEAVLQATPESEQAAKRLSKAAAFAGGNWKNPGSAFCLERAMEETSAAETSGKQDAAALAASYRATATQYQRAAGFYLQAAEAVLQDTPESQQVVERFSKAAAFAGFGSEESGSAYCLEEASEFLKKASDAEASGKPDGAALAASYRDTVTHYQRASDFYIQAAEAYAIGNEEEGEQLKNVGEYLLRHVNCLKNVIEAVQKAALATHEGKQELAELWKKIKKENGVLSNYRYRTSEAYCQRNLAEAERLMSIGDKFRDAEDKLKKAAAALEKAIKAEADGHEAQAAQYREEAAQHERDADELLKKLTEVEETKKVEADPEESKEDLNYAIQSIHPLILDRERTANELLDVAALKQHSEELFRKAAEACPIGTLPKTEQGDRWRKAGEGFTKVATNLEEATKAEEDESLGSLERRVEVARQWREAAAKYQEASRYYEDSGNFYMEWGVPGGERLYDMLQGAEQNWAEAERLEARAHQEEDRLRHPSCWSWVWHCIYGGT